MILNNYKLVKASQLEDFTRPFLWSFPLETDKAITSGDVNILRSHALYIYKNFGPLRVAIQEKAMYAVGHNHWLPIYFGADQDFKAEVVPWLKDNWYPVCNVLGEEFDYQTTLFLMSIHLDVFGEFFLYLTIADDTYPGADDGGYPQIQIVPCYRVGQPRRDGVLDSQNRLDDSQYAGVFNGFKCVQGIVKNKQGRAIAYNVLADDEADDSIVAANDMIRVRELDLGDETRATPTSSHGINQGRSILSLIENEQDFLEMASRINILEWNESGGLDPSDPQNLLSLSGALPPGSPAGGGDSIGVTSPAPFPVNGGRVQHYEWLQKAQTRYFNAKSPGSKIQAFQFQRPAEEWHRFIDKLGRFLIDNIWPYHLVDREADLGGAQVRGLLARANRLILDRQQLIRRPARRSVQYAVAKGAKIGRIPTSNDWWQWDFTKPARISVDYGRDSKADLAEIEGEILDPADTVEARGGGDYEDFCLRFYRNKAIKIQARQQVEQETGVDLEDETRPPEPPPGPPGPGDESGENEPANESSQ